MGIISAPACRLALIIAALAADGCVFDQLQRSNESDIQRVEQKQATLKVEEDRSARLRQQEDELEAELGERQFSLTEINDRVERLQADNGRAIADNESTRRGYDDLIARLQQTNAQLSALQRGTDGPLEQRRERIEYLKSQIKAQLQLLLH